MKFSSSRTLESTVAPLDKGSYHFDPKNMRHIAAILREMYSDPILAVVREYAANGTDAHVQAGCADRPLEISVPTLENSTLEFRDYGIGLTDDQIKDLLLGYGSSGDHKRESDTYIGGFGIGGKSAFAVADQFTFTSVHAGQESVWLCYRDADDDCQAVKTSGGPTKQESGVLVSIPIPTDLIGDVLFSVSNAFRYYRVKPILKNTTEELNLFVNRPASPVCFGGDLLVTDKKGTELSIKWETVNDQSNLQEHGLSTSYVPIRRSSRRFDSDDLQSAVVMGGIWYPLDLSKATTDDSLKINGLILHAPVGALQLAPSRESLSYTSRVKDTLTGILKSIYRDMQNQVINKINNVKSCRELFDVINTFEENFSKNLQTSISQGGNLKRELFSRSLTPTGFEVRRDDFDRVINSYFKTSYQRRVGSVSRYSLTDLFSESSDVVRYTIGQRSHLVYLTYANDEERKQIKNFREIFARVCSHVWPKGIDPVTGIESHKTYTAINICIGSETAKGYPWLTDGSSIQVKVSELPETADETWLELTSPVKSNRGGSRGSSNRGVYSQHGKKFNVLKQVVGNYGSLMSSNWGPVKAEDLADDASVVFVYHDRFVPCPHRDAYQSWYHMKNMTGCFPELNRGLFGLRVSDKQWVEKNQDKYNLVKFEDYINSKFMNTIEKNFDVTRDQLEALFYLSCLACDNRKVPFAVPFIIGAYNHNVPEWDALLKPFFMDDRSVLVKHFCSFMHTTRGRTLASSLNWSAPILSSLNLKRCVSIGDEVDRSKFSLVQKTFADMLERIGSKSNIRYNMFDTLNNYVDTHENDRPEDGITLTAPLHKWYTSKLHSPHMLYSLLLCFESTGI